mgnify:CR=1 FL=1
MFLMHILAQVRIIGGLIILFLLLYIINHHTKAPKGVEVPEKCISCASETCMIKLVDANELKEELKKELEKCENEGEENDRQE